MRLQFKGQVFVENHHLAVPFHELKAVRSRGTSPKASLHDNLIVEGDNLAALKALLPTYHSRVKCIYIDPPYNTGNEGWAYSDQVNSPMMQDWFGKVVDRDDLTRHDKWCCMMLPRLKLLRELLTDDGAIFVSIDDNEVHRLRFLMDDIFGEAQHVATFVRRRRLSTGLKRNPVSPDHEYVLCYARQIDSVEFIGTRRMPHDYAREDSIGRYRSTDLTIGMSAEMRPNQYYTLVDPNTGSEYLPPEDRVWRFERNTMAKEVQGDNIIWPSTSKKRGNRMTRPRYKTRYNPEDEKTNPISTWIGAGRRQRHEGDDGVRSLSAKLNTGATRELKELFGKQVFTYPKPVSLIQELIRASTDKDSIVLDSFAGSGTTAHAVLALNKEDGGSRRFVLVECEDYVDTLTAERVRRVIKGVPGAKDKDLAAGLGGTFSYFKVGRPMRRESMFKPSRLPGYEKLAGYVFFTATGEEFNPDHIDRQKWFIGASTVHDVFLIYDTDVGVLKNMALTLDIAKNLPDSGRKRLVFAPTKYMDAEMLHQHRVVFSQLPFEIYETVGRLAT